MKIRDALTQAAERLRSADIDEPIREASSLLQASIERDRTFLIAHPEHELRLDEVRSFEQMVERRSTHEPFHYIIGKKEFYGLEFIVTQAVLIPRPETEQLVALAIEILGNGLGPKRILDVGTGSGCIPISIVKNVDEVSAVATDLSAEAVAVAAENARLNGVADRIEFLQSDLLERVADSKFDLVTANLPYIPAVNIAGLQTGVRDFEPVSALTDGGDGLSLIGRLVGRAPSKLNYGGVILLEIGIGQSDNVIGMFDPEKWTEVEAFPDFQRIPRVIKAVRRCC